MGLLSPALFPDSETSVGKLRMEYRIHEDNLTLAVNVWSTAGGHPFSKRQYSNLQDEPGVALKLGLEVITLGLYEQALNIPDALRRLEYLTPPF